MEPMLEKQGFTFKPTIKGKQHESKEEWEANQKRNKEIKRENRRILQAQLDAEYELEQAQSFLTRVKEEADTASSDISQKKTEIENLETNIKNLKTEYETILNQFKTEEEKLATNLANDLELNIGYAYGLGTKDGANGYNELDKYEQAHARATAITTVSQKLQKSLEAYNSLHQSMQTKLQAIADRYTLSAKQAAHRMAGDLEIFTGQDGKVSQYGKEVLRNKIEERLAYRNTVNRPDDWLPFLHHYWKLSEAKQKKYIDQMVDYSVALAEASKDACIDPTQTYAPISKIKEWIDKTISATAVYVVNKLQQLQEQQLEHLR